MCGHQTEIYHCFHRDCEKFLRENTRPAICEEALRIGRRGSCVHGISKTQVVHFGEECPSCRIRREEEQVYYDLRRTAQRVTGNKIPRAEREVLERKRADAAGRGDAGTGERGKGRKGVSEGSGSGRKGKKSGAEESVKGKGKGKGKEKGSETGYGSDSSDSAEGTYKW